MRYMTNIEKLPFLVYAFNAWIYNEPTLNGLFVTNSSIYRGWSTCKINIISKRHLFIHPYTYVVRLHVNDTIIEYSLRYIYKRMIYSSTVLQAINMWMLNRYELVLKFYWFIADAFAIFFLQSFLYNSISCYTWPVNNNV